MHVTMQITAEKMAKLVKINSKINSLSAAGGVFQF